MSTVKVYFVRHGQSTFNIEKTRHQFPQTPLSELGHKQAAAVAKRFESIPIDLVLTSSYTRALQTAQAIEAIKHVPLVKSDLLIERKMPSLFHGQLMNDPDILTIHQTIREHFSEPEWHYADEENFTDLVSRVKAVLDFTRSQNKEHIVVVTHGYFLVLLISFILFGENVTYPLFASFRDHAAYSNTGVTLCEYKKEKWKLLTWNDYAHLGEA